MEQNGWVKWVAMTVCVVVLTIGGCSMHENYVFQQAVKNGADPIKVGCAMSSNPSTATCVLEAAGDQAAEKGSKP